MNEHQRFAGHRSETEFESVEWGIAVLLLIAHIANRPLRFSEVVDHIADGLQFVEDIGKAPGGKQEALPRNHILDTSLVAMRGDSPSAEPEP
jgi:hypothetical protein